MTTIEVSAALGDDALGEEWFGEGSVFDSAEELAAALLALATPALAGAVVGGPVAPAGNLGAAPSATSRSASTPPRGLVAEPMGEFQVAAMPSFAKRPPAPVRPHSPGWQPTPEISRPQATGWSIRQSVQILRTTEEILVRLREEAATLAWEWAAAAHREVQPEMSGAAAGGD
jgi:hypothetical protein